MEADTITIELPVQLYSQLQALAEEEREEPLDVLSRLIKMAMQRREKPKSRTFQFILDRATDLGIDDLAEQHDHYLYGVEKR